MEFLAKNKTLVALGLAIALVVLGAVFKVDVGGLLKEVGTVNTEVGKLIDVPATDHQ